MFDGGENAMPQGEGKFREQVYRKEAPKGPRPFKPDESPVGSKEETAPLADSLEADRKRRLEETRRKILGE